MLLTHLFFSENRSSKPKFTRSEKGKPCSFILLGKTGFLKFQGLGLYPAIRHHHFTPPRESNPTEPSSTDVEDGSGERTKDPPYINNISGIEPRELFNESDFPPLHSSANI